MSKRNAVPNEESVADIVRPFGEAARVPRKAPIATFGGVGTPPPVQRTSIWDGLLDRVEEQTAEEPGEWLSWTFGTEKEARAAQGAVSGRLKPSGDFHYKSKVRNATLYVQRVAGPAPKRGGGA